MKNQSNISEPILGRGIEVFGDEEKFRDWYSTECPALGNKKPSECSDNDVLDQLGRIEHGIIP